MDWLQLAYHYLQLNWVFLFSFSYSLKGRSRGDTPGATGKGPNYDSLLKN